MSGDYTKNTQGARCHAATKRVGCGVWERRVGWCVWAGWVGIMCRYDAARCLLRHLYVYIIIITHLNIKLDYFCYRNK